MRQHAAKLKLIMDVQGLDEIEPGSKYSGESIAFYEL
jgi:hypothetical protein